jgi:hypothetical protein
MSALEVWGSRGCERVVTLSESSYTIGSDAESAQIVLDDPAVSQVHAILERIGSTWLVRDVGSRNGTRVMSDRVIGQRRLRHRDEILVGRTRLIFLDGASERRKPTDAIASPPGNITKKENEVLVELCRPLLMLNTFTPPATVREIAAKLFVGVQAVKAHLTHLYDKFDIAQEPGVNRRVVLANEAMQRGAVTMADLDAGSDDEGRGA